MHLAREYLLALDGIWTTTLKHFLQTAFSYRYNLIVPRGDYEINKFDSSK